MPNSGQDSRLEILTPVSANQIDEVTATVKDLISEIKTKRACSSCTSLDIIAAFLLGVFVGALASFIMCSKPFLGGQHERSQPSSKL